MKWREVLSSSWHSTSKNICQLSSLGTHIENWVVTLEFFSHFYRHFFWHDSATNSYLCPEGHLSVAMIYHQVTRVNQHSSSNHSIRTHAYKNSQKFRGFFPLKMIFEISLANDVWNDVRKLTCKILALPILGTFLMQINFEVYVVNKVLNGNIVDCLRGNTRKKWGSAVCRELRRLLWSSGCRQVKVELAE